MRILLINNGSRYLEELKVILKKNGEVTVVDNVKGLSYSLDFDLVVLSGGHDFSIIGHEDYYQEEISFIKNNKIPLLGICLGAELIAYAFGAKLEPLEGKEEGEKMVRVLQQDGIFNGLDNFEVFENHKWAITQLSEDLIGMAKSNDGYEVIKHRNLPIFGFQFHPEVLKNRNVGIKIFENFLKQITSNKVLSSVFN